MLRTFAVMAYTLVGLGLAVQGLRYLVASKYMHYHAEVIHERWSQLGAGEKRLMLGLLRGFGAGMFCLGLATVFLAQGPLADGAYRAHWILATLTVLYTALLTHITRVALHPGAAPIAVTGAMFGLSLAAALASCV